MKCVTIRTPSARRLAPDLARGGHRVQDALHHPFLKMATGVQRWLLNRGAAFRFAHGQHVDQPLVDALPKGAWIVASDTRPAA